MMTRGKNMTSSERCNLSIYPCIHAESLCSYVHNIRPIYKISGELKNLACQYSNVRLPQVPALYSSTTWNPDQKHIQRLLCLCHHHHCQNHEFAGIFSVSKIYVKIHSTNASAGIVYFFISPPVYGSIQLTFFYWSWIIFYVWIQLTFYNSNWLAIHNSIHGLKLSATFYGFIFDLIHSIWVQVESIPRDSHIGYIFTRKV